MTVMHIGISYHHVMMSYPSKTCKLTAQSSEVLCQVNIVLQVSEHVTDLPKHSYIQQHQSYILITSST